MNGHNMVTRAAQSINSSARLKMLLDSAHERLPSRAVTALGGSYRKGKGYTISRKSIPECLNPNTMPHSSRGSRPASPGRQVDSRGSYAIPLVIRHRSYNFDNQPKRLLLGEQLLPLLVDFALHLELDFTKLDNRIVSFRLGQYTSHTRTFSSSRRSCSSFRRTL